MHTGSFPDRRLLYPGGICVSFNTHPLGNLIQFHCFLNRPHKFRDNLKDFVKQVVNEHLPLKVTRRSGEDFVVISAEDWAREQETLYVLQNNDLMKQIAASVATHSKKTGYTPTSGELDEITGVWG